MLSHWCQELGALGMPDALHDRLSLRHPHHQDEELFNSAVYGKYCSECHSHPMMSGRESGPAQRAFQTYLSTRGAAENEESGMSRIVSSLHLVALPLPPSLLRADGSVVEARRLASDVSFNIL